MMLVVDRQESKSRFGIMGLGLPTPVHACVTLLPVKWAQPFLHRLSELQGVFGQCPGIYVYIQVALVPFSWASGEKKMCTWMETSIPNAPARPKKYIHV